MDKQYFGIRVARSGRKKGQHAKEEQFGQVQPIVYGETDPIKSYEQLRNEGFTKWLCAAYTNFKESQTNDKS